jgi:Predicted periplasmic solute-binding protein
MRRRVAAVAIVVLTIAVIFALVKISSGGSSVGVDHDRFAPPKPFRIVFPEGFTRDEMAQRVQAVALIAEHKRQHKKVRLSRRTYLAVSHPRRLAGFGERRPLEGFLFPATYDFLTGTTSRQLVQGQLAAFAENWSKVNLAYARKKNLTPYDVLIIASLVEKEALVPDERPKIARVIYNRLHAG